MHALEEDENMKRNGIVIVQVGSHNANSQTLGFHMARFLKTMPCHLVAFHVCLLNQSMNPCFVNALLKNVGTQIRVRVRMSTEGMCI